ncbi:hypothetical protein [Vulgatibacter sp.]|uniref:hypothetical protein n=1 Tax=Vulgatibacter sp. TaxID=1971226 RepID=UPI00356232DE
MPPTTKTISVAAAVLLAAAAGVAGGMGGDDTQLAAGGVGGTEATVPTCYGMAVHMDCASVKSLPGGDAYQCDDGAMLGVAVETKVESGTTWPTLPGGESARLVVHGPATAPIDCANLQHPDEPVALVPPESHPGSCLVGQVHDAGQPAVGDLPAVPPRDFDGRCCGPTCSVREGGVAAHVIGYELAGAETWRDTFCRILPDSDGCTSQDDPEL